MLKKTLLAGAATVLLSVPAMAADFVEATPVSSWTAFYLGAGIGAAWSDFDTKGKYCEDYGAYCWDDNSYWYYDFKKLFGSDDDTAFRGIGQLGFDWEVAPSFVLGVFGDLNFGQGTGASSKYSYDYWDGEDWWGYHDKFSYEVDNLWTLGGRVGWGTENTLFYGLVGYSWADTEAKLGLFCEDGTGACWIKGKNDDTVNGWTFGGGVEFKGWMWDTVSTSIEYRYTDLDSVSATAWNGDDYWKAKIDQDIQQINLVFKYRFGM
ncbi:MAG: outer membrane beta-barrel protein [Rhizobiales bacterium]|nr:outer membrane beta-barrel protein [Hyphomicrobiales bacterium]